MTLEGNNSEENFNAYNKENNHLVELGGSDYEIADGEPDIKGWDVKNEHGEKIGEVEELLFDPQSRKVRYIILDVNANELGIDLDRKVLVPIGVATIYNSDTEDDAETRETYTASDTGPVYENDHEHHTVIATESAGIEDLEHAYDSDEAFYNPDYDSDVVIIPATIEQLRVLPAYEKGNVSPEAEIGIRRIFDGNGVIDSTGYNRNEFYDHGHFNEQGYFNRDAATPPIQGSNEARENEKL